MNRYLRTEHCRMAALVQHFGDGEDAQKPCGVCDRCNPAQVALQVEEVTRVSARRTSRHKEFPPPQQGSARRRRSVPTEEPEFDAPKKLVDALKLFRRDEAKARSIPAFHVLTDRALYALAERAPTKRS